jgi:chromosome segregation ATPase
MKLRRQTANININSLLIPLATVGGLIIGIALNQFGRDKGISPVDLVSPIRPANASPNAPLQKETPQPVETVRISSRPAALVKTPDAQKSIQRLKDYLKNTEEKSGFLKEKVELLNNLLNSKEKELSKLSTDNAMLKENLNKTVELQNKLKADFEASSNSLNAQLNQKDANISSLNTVKVNFENQLSELNNKLSVLSADYAALQGKFALLEQEKTTLETRLGRVKEDLDRQEAVNDTLNNNVSEAAAKLADKEKERADIGKQLEQLSAAKKEIESELAQLKVTKADNDNSIKQLNSRVNELNGLSEEAKKSLFQMSNLLAGKEQEINEKQNEIAGLKDNLVKSDGAKSLLLASLDEKEKTVRELNLALNSMESRTALLQKELAAEKERQARAAQQLAEAVSLNKNLKRKLKNIYIELELIRAERPDPR